jgi:hypothetical protein
MVNSPRELPRAARPSSRRGYVETLGDPYYKRVPLPRILEYQCLTSLLPLRVPIFCAILSSPFLHPRRLMASTVALDGV